MALEAERLVDRLADLVRHADGLGGGVDVVQQHHELVAALAGRQVAGPQAAAQALGRLDQQGVAGGVAEAVVDGLEAVEVEEQHREAGRVAPGDEQAGVEVFEEHRPVGEAGEGVVGGQVMHALLGGLAFGDVGEGHDHAAQLAVGVHVRGVGHQRGEQTAVGPLQLLLEAVSLALGQTLSERPAAGERVVGVERLEAAPQQVPVAVAQHGGQAGVDEGEAQLRVEGGDAVLGQVDQRAVAQLAGPQGRAGAGQLAGPLAGDAQGYRQQHHEAADQYHRQFLEEGGVAAGGRVGEEVEGQRPRPVVQLEQGLALQAALARQRAVRVAVEQQGVGAQGVVVEDADPEVLVGVTQGAGEQVA